MPTTDTDRPYDDDPAYVADEVEVVLTRLTLLAVERESPTNWMRRRDARRLRHAVERGQRHVDARLAATRTAGRTVALDVVQMRFNLGDLERQVLLFAGAHAIKNTEVELLCGRVDGHRRAAPCLETILSALDVPWIEQVRAMPMFTGEGKLAESLLVEVGLGLHPIHPCEILGASIKITSWGLLAILGVRDVEY